MKSHLYVDISILQTVPPSNLNRDDAGSPKHATYGGAHRARVSSQAWKRATRTLYAAGIPDSDRATRTKKITELLANRIEDRHGLSRVQAERLAAALLKPLGITASKKKEEQSAYLLFFGHQQLDGISALLGDRAVELSNMADDDLGQEMSKLDVGTQLSTGHPEEVALFGRMVADLAGLNVDASVQVAHALSTHAVDIEFDYYTAVDDENPKDEPGAGMIGMIQFNAATLYRYATIGVHQLRDNLTDTATVAAATRRFVDTFTRSMPTGHQNAFAHRTMPHLVAVMLRTDQPVNLVSAFEKPVYGTRGVADESVRRLAKEASTVSDQWGLVPQRTLATYSPLGNDDNTLASAFGASMPFPQLLEQLEQSVTTWLSKDGTK